MKITVIVDNIAYFTSSNPTFHFTPTSEGKQVYFAFSNVLLFLVLSSQFYHYNVVGSPDSILPSTINAKLRLHYQFFGSFRFITRHCNNQLGLHCKNRVEQPFYSRIAVRFRYPSSLYSKTIKIISLTFGSF